MPRAALLERVPYRAETVVITRSAKPVAVMISLEEYRRLLDPSGGFMKRSPVPVA
jgi:PHD/YefM family antitoxin component YafN of YafNO toxin-antitoxin module